MVHLGLAGAGRRRQRRRLVLLLIAALLLVACAPLDRSLPAPPTAAPVEPRPTPLDSPTAAVVVDGEGFVYVADTHNNRIQKLSTRSAAQPR